MKKVQVPEYTQNDGYKIPAIGLGTYTSLAGDCERSVREAINAGYRFIETAYFYENEKEVGKAVRDKISDGVIKREDMYIATKLWNTFHEPSRVEYICRKQLDTSGLDYFDAYLMHWPFGYFHRGDTVMTPYDINAEVELNEIDYIHTWKSMEKLVGLGLTRSIGVANFNSEQLKRLLNNCTIKPVQNQIECNPGLHPKKLIDLCKEYNIIVTAFCPMGKPDEEHKTPDYMFDPEVKKIANKYHKSNAQVVLRYLVQIGVVPIAKTIRSDRLAENINVFDFSLTQEEQHVLELFHTGNRLMPMEHSQKSIYYPFNIKDY